MSEVKIDGNYVKFSQYMLAAPTAMIKDMKQTLQGEMKGIKQQMLVNVSGGVLKRVSGRLAKSIKSRARIYNKSKVWAQAGSRWYIGRFWEFGMTRRGKTYAPRQWATPVAQANLARLQGIVEQVIQRNFQGP